MRIRTAVFAAVLLAAGMSNQSAHAMGRLAGIKWLFSNHKATAHKSSDQSYATLADHLYMATQSTELADNIKAAGSLLSDNPYSDQNTKELAQAFGSLKGDPSDPKSFCGKHNLANVLRLAKGIRDGGNLGPMEITDPIHRLNKIVVTVIARACEVCDPYLTGKWPKPWQPKFSGSAMESHIDKLHFVARSFSYEGYVHTSESQGDDRFGVSLIIKEGEEEAAQPIDPDEPEPLTTQSTNVIAKQLDEYVYKPCSEFVRFDESKEVLLPFNDMLKSWYVVSSHLLEEYYKNEHSHKPSVHLNENAAGVRHLAAGYQACQRFLATPKVVLAERISKYRAHGAKSGHGLVHHHVGHNHIV